VLDLFAGSGALGLEALSRGAQRATFVESAPAALTALRANLEALGAEAEVVRADAVRWLRGASRDARQYDLVFLDPPYRRAAELGAPLSESLPALLAPGALVVAESDRRTPLELTITATDERRYGDTIIRIHAA
jgi:16S rRNA (guanine966-N2)-methyltransferase